MTKEENLHWIDQEIKTWENDCQSKHPIKEALYAARMALEQEPKPMIEIDLYSVIKQKYIEREVLDKISAEIQRLRGCSCSCSDGIIDDVEGIIDKYEAESEVKANENEK